MASRAGLPMAKRTMSWVWEASSEVLESMTEPTRPEVRAASGSAVVVGGVMVGPLVVGLVGLVRAGRGYAVGRGQILTTSSWGSGARRSGPSSPSRTDSDSS